MTNPIDRPFASAHYRGARTACLSLALVLTTAVLEPGRAHAADYCRIYSGPDQTGSSHLVDLPGLQETYSPVGWSTSSRRAIGEELHVTDGAVWRNAESLRIVAVDSAVSFFGYTGDNMDGVFQVVRCAKGNTCNWTFGSMRNEMRSFDCQRDLGGVVIPTVDIADNVTEQLDDQAEANSQIETSDLKYGRIAWTNVRARCERTGVGCGNTWEEKYKDTLEYVGKLGVEPHPAELLKQYDVWITFWLNPEVAGSPQQFRIDETWWKLDIEEGTAADELLAGFEDAIDPLFNESGDLGDQITQSIHDAIIDTLGPILGNSAIRNAKRIYPDYACGASDFAQHRPHWPGYSYSSYLQSAPCGYGMPTYAYPPVLKLVLEF
jgi:hypothetical protein